MSYIQYLGLDAKMHKLRSKTLIIISFPPLLVVDASLVVIEINTNAKDKSSVFILALS